MVNIPQHIKPILLRILKLLIRTICVAILGFVVVFSYTHLFLKPSNDRTWTLDQAILPQISLDGDLITIQNVRDFIYASTTSYTPRYYTETYDLSLIESVDFVVEPLSTPLIAHTFLTFTFTDGKRVALSVEIRKEKGESFSPLKGLLNQYELMYVIASEEDLLKLRAIHRKDELYLYPTTADKNAVRKLFVDMLTRAQNLQTNPEFYNTLTSTCTTNIYDHINQILGKDDSLSFDLRILFPSNVDEYAYEQGLILTTLPFSQTRQKYRISELVHEYENYPDFSDKIRGESETM